MFNVAGISLTPLVVEISFLHDGLQIRGLMELVLNLMNKSHLHMAVRGLRRLTRVKMELFDLKETCLIVFLVLLAFSSVN